MKLTAPLLALTLAVSAAAQTATPAPAPKPATATTAKPAAKPATSATAAHTTTVHKAATATAAAAPGALPANIPVIKGLKKSLYALSYIDITVGTGPLAEPSMLGKSQADSKIMWYTVHYTGWLAKDGTKFDSSVDRGTPITFPYGVGKVIPGWDTGFEGMHIGGKRRIFVPYQLAYGASGRPPVIPAKADLIFDVELVGVSDKPPAPPTPPAAEKTPTTPAPAGAPKPSAAPAAAPATPAPPTPPAAAPAATPAPAAPAKPATK